LAGETLLPPAKFLRNFTNGALPIALKVHPNFALSFALTGLTRTERKIGDRHANKGLKPLVP
jgi:hypothetical protein